MSEQSALGVNVGDYVEEDTGRFLGKVRRIDQNADGSFEFVLQPAIGLGDSPLRLANEDFLVIDPAAVRNVAMGAYALEPVHVRAGSPPGRHLSIATDKPTHGRILDLYITLYAKAEEPGGWYTGVWRSKPFETHEASDPALATIHFWMDASGAHVELLDIET